ncbi:MAG: hypothetical protein D6701_11630, partial [Gemmatimonadetes bacterium]
PEGFEALLADLAAGPRYEADVPTGRIEGERVGEDGTRFPWFALVPDDYDPQRRYPVRVYLHGGIGRPLMGGGAWWRGPERVAGPNHIAVFPAAWNTEPWWRRSQIENLREILATLRATYNTDENRVALYGVSDGGTGVYFVAFVDTTPWASFLPFIGHPAVLLNPQQGADGQLHVGNLRAKPLFIVNGETDHLYPVRSLTPFLEAFEEAGVDFEFTARPEGHTTVWWPELAGRIGAFIAEHPRRPHPERVVWAAAGPGPYARAHWVVIDEVGPIEGDRDRAALAGLSADGRAGVVDARREGNRITVDAYHVRRLRLLVSPDAFDLSRPIVVVANGRVVFDALVEPDADVLARWAARDVDRTMLYAAEVVVELPAEGGG